MTTNQSFIKAYRQDAPQPSPSRPASTAASRSTASAARPNVAALGTSVEIVAAGIGQSVSTPSRSASAPTTHVDPNAANWPACDAPFGRIDAPEASSSKIDPPKREAAIGKRPLSAFTAQSRAPIAAPDRAPHAPLSDFEPATTVASFAWPSVCRALCRECGPELDRIADRLLREAQQGRSLIGMIGLFPQLGTTTTVLCVAARLAARPCKAIVVEGNFLAPQLSRWLDATPTAWWQDVLERNAPTADAVIRATDNRLDVLPLDAKTSNPLRLASRLQVFNTASALRTAYDLALVDLGAFFDPDLQPIALELVRNMRLDGVLAVTGPSGADPRDLATIANYLGECGCDLLGTVENRIAKDS